MTIRSGPWSRRFLPGAIADKPCAASTTGRLQRDLLPTVSSPSQQSHEFRLTVGYRFLEYVRKVGARGWNGDILLCGR